MSMTLQNWGILRGLEYLSEAEKEFDYHGVVSLHGDEALEAINGITELRLQVRRAVWEREADLLPRDGEACETIKPDAARAEGTPDVWTLRTTPPSS